MMGHLRRQYFLPLILCLLSPSADWATGQAPDPNREIRESAEKFVTAFNEHNAPKLAKLWTADGEYINEQGVRFAGRDAIKSEYQIFFNSLPNVRMRIAIDSIRMLSATTAIEEGTASLTPLPPGAPASSRYTVIHVRGEGGWQMASVRDKRMETRSTYGLLSELDWLIGNWKSERGSVVASVQGQWVADKSFIQRRFVITRAGQTISTTIELIGWDAENEQIASWSFQSGGGRAVGVWTQTDEGWLVREAGSSVQGAPSTSVNWWTPLQDGAIGWSSTLRTANETQLKDPKDLVLHRVPRSSDASTGK